jgi:transketolase N-terminal domain/subunit
MFLKFLTFLNLIFKKINIIFILLKRDSAVTLSSVLSYLEISENFKLDNFHKSGGPLIVYTSQNKKLPGIEIETGYLGNGLVAGSGIAFSNIKKIKKLLFKLESYTKDPIGKQCF